MINLSYHFLLGNSRVERKNDMSKVVTSAKQLGEVFPNEETFQRIYEECIEHEPCVTSAVTDSYRDMGDMFNRYLNAIQEHMFRYAYQCGYEAAIAAYKKGGAA